MSYSIHLDRSPASEFGPFVIFLKSFIHSPFTKNREDTVPDTDAQIRPSPCQPRPGQVPQSEAFWVYICGVSMPRLLQIKVCNVFVSDQGRRWTHRKQREGKEKKGTWPL